MVVMSGSLATAVPPPMRSRPLYGLTTWRKGPRESERTITIADSRRFALHERCSRRSPLRRDVLRSCAAQSARRAGSDGVDDPASGGDDTLGLLPLDRVPRIDDNQSQSSDCPKPQRDASQPTFHVFPTFDARPPLSTIARLLRPEFDVRADADFPPGLAIARRKRGREAPAHERHARAGVAAFQPWSSAQPLETRSAREPGWALG
jgi:hypothetical protein